MVSSTQSCHDSEGNLVRVQTELRLTQDSLTNTEALLAQSRKGREHLEKDVHTQLNDNHKLHAEISDLRSKMEKLTAKLNSSQSEQVILHQKDLDEAERLNKNLKQKVETLLTEIEIHKQNTALAEDETNRVQQALRAEHEDRLAKLIEAHEEKMAAKTFEFDQANEAIQMLQDEVEDLTIQMQDQMDKTFSLQQTIKDNAETFKMDRDDSPDQKPEATSSKDPIKPIFYPSVAPKGESGPKGLAISAEEETKDEWGGWHPLDNPAISHGFSSRKEYEEDQRLYREYLASRKKDVSQQIVPLADQIMASNQGNQDGGNTPTLSAIPAVPSANFALGKKTSERITIGGWPTMKGFIAWKLAFLKAVAAASISPDPAFIWICYVMSAKSIDDLNDSGDFPALDALLSTEWDKILSGKFKKSVQVLEYELLKQQKMLKGRQITWLVFDHFKLSDVDGAMLNWDKIIRLKLHMPGDNIKQFLNDWDTTFANMVRLTLSS